MSLPYMSAERDISVATRVLTLIEYSTLKGHHLTTKFPELSKSPPSILDMSTFAPVTAPRSVRIPAPEIFTRCPAVIETPLDVNELLAMAYK